MFARWRRARVREAVFASVGILVALLVLKHLGASSFAAPYVGTVALAVQLYVPIWRIGRSGISRRSLGLTLRAWRTDLGWFLAFAAVVTLPYVLSVHVWMTEGRGLVWAPRWPSELLENVFVQVLGVALAEELYFRGYLQERWSAWWPGLRRGRGAGAIVITALVFALAHVVGDYRVTRFGPFFPGLLFGILRARTGSIASAVAFHAYCNLLADVITGCYARG